MDLRNIRITIDQNGEALAQVPQYDNENYIVIRVAKIEKSQNVPPQNSNALAWESLLQTCIEVASSMKIGGDDFNKGIISHLGASLAIFDRSKMTNVEYLKSKQAEGRVVTNNDTPTENNQ